MGTEPSPFHADVIPALESAKQVSDEITDTIRVFLATPPYDSHPDFVTALQGVQESSQFMSDTIDDAIIQVSGANCVRDNDFPGQDVCVEQENCVWIEDADPELEYCCCTLPTAP